MEKSINSILITALVALLVVVGYNMLVTNPASTVSADEGVFINIQTGPDSNHDNHKLAMAMTVAKMSLGDNQDVLILFNIDGVELAVERSEDIVFTGHDGTEHNITQMLSEVMDMGAKVVVCPACLQAKGYSEEDLKDGIEMNKHDNLFGFTEGRIISFSY